MVRGFRGSLGRTTGLGYFSLRGQEKGSQESECLFHHLQMGTWSHSEHTLSSAWDNLALTEYALYMQSVFLPVSPKFWGFFNMVFG